VIENENLEKHLKIVVPYRDREEHLVHFLPHIREYMDDCGISYHIVIAEQAEGLPFNRGAMKNAGFLLSGTSDYTCFHDVDYLPLNADYSWADNPACLVLIGAEGRPAKINDKTQRIHLNTVSFFGGAVLMPDALFRQIDGYSNDYWGWGFEDTDIARRFEAAGISCIRRPGTFYPLTHVSQGHEADGSMNEDAALNRVFYNRKWHTGRLEKADGLSTLSYEILARETLAAPIRGNGMCEKIKVRLFQP
jgi:hypothetical protein